MELAARAKVPIEPIRRAERSNGEATLTSEHEGAIRGTLEAAGVIFTDEDDPGVRLKRGGQDLPPVIGD
jgi:hypothetical protein